MAKLFLALCASALLVQAISGQCIGNVGAGISNIGISGCGSGLGYGSGLNAGIYGNAGLGLGAATGLAAAGLSSPINGGGLAVSSASPLAPSGLAVVSQNELSGPVYVEGALPFMTAIALEGEVPSGGAAGVQYSCGNGNVGIVSENVAAVGNGYGGGLGYGAGLGYVAGLGYGTGLGYGAGIGAGLIGTGYGAGSCGCGNIY